MILEIVIILLLTLLNGFFALSEIAFVSARKSTIEHLADQGNPRAKAILKLFKNPEYVLSSVQVGITLIGIISGAYGGIVLTDDLEALLASFVWLSPYTHDVALVVVVGGITCFTIVIGELVPKSIALNNPESVVLACMPIVKYFTWLTYPFVKILAISTAFVVRIIGIKGKNRQTISEEELRFHLKTAGKLGVLNKEESEVHQNLFYFSDQVAKSLMTPRNQLEWININAPVQEILEKIKNSIHSKFPVCEDSLDNVKGVTTTKTFLENYNTRGFDLKNFLTEPIFISQYMPAFYVLTQFRKKKQYLGFVVNESGVVKGILTLKDLMEAIIGDLPELNEKEEQITNTHPSTLHKQKSNP